MDARMAGVQRKEEIRSEGREMWKEGSDKE